jgi:non-ribosomal peptide synthetase component F
VLEPLIGCFVNILPIRTRLAPEMEFDDLLRQVTASVQEALDHQSYPYDLLVRHLDRGDGSAARPFIDVIYVYQSAAQIRAAIGENAALDTNRPIALLDFAFAFAKAELCLNIADHGSAGIGLTLEYDIDVFTAPTIDRHLAILDQFARSIAG